MTGKHELDDSEALILRCHVTTSIATGHPSILFLKYNTSKYSIQLHAKKYEVCLLKQMDFIREQEVRHALPMFVRLGGEGSFSREAAQRHLLKFLVGAARSSDAGHTCTLVVGIITTPSRIACSANVPFTTRPTPPNPLWIMLWGHTPSRSRSASGVESDTDPPPRAE